MQHIAETFLSHSAPRRFRLRLSFSRKTWTTLFAGVLSAGLYYLLYHYSADIRALAEATNRGDKAYFLVPIAIAFVFSLVHGDFTGRFWDSIGLRAKH